ncbi:ArnT family glycosyltransferase [Maridesulfovibrio hydrothermalis]|uniref:Glycosyl transferase family 39 n=1 Tax=Maridesulfovibrio hydrothermalis AM13 = DSM 14728 TaxID=1121451 RepID=L0R626_9BACT|nr:glycosyltransferase family 39 protein [Maridesulfovibrio hydrothermalis]CCO22134.1 Glycosyl transferase family 39 [Maridesulfovibrio hydrothermalis AM13 = DSM 14728]
MRNEKQSLVWDIMEDHPWLSALFIIALQSAFTMDYRSLWFSDEVRYAEVYHQMKDAGHWLVMYLNGVAYPDKPPVYFWFLSLIDTVTPADGVSVFFLGSAVSAAIFLLSTVALARTLGCGRKTTLATGLVLLTNIFFLGIAHYSRMDLLFASFIIWANICLFKGFHSRCSGKWFMSAFALMGIATLTKGPLGLIFPLLTSVCYLIWKQRLSLLRDKALLKGLAILVAILIAWVVGAVIVDGTAFIHNIFYKQIYQRAVSSFHHEEPFQYYLIAFPLAWLPWTMAIFALPVKKLFTIDHWVDVAGMRKSTLTDGRDWAWIMFISGFVLLTCLSIKVLIYILPLFAPLAMLTAKGLLGENGKAPVINSKRLWIGIASVYLTFAVAAPFAEVFFPFDFALKGLSFTVLILGLGGLALLAVKTSGGKMGLLVMVATMVLWIQPLALQTLPSLDPLMSPRQTGEMMKGYVEQGSYPLAHKIYSGIFSYYAGTNIHETSDLAEIESILAEKDDVILVMQKKYYDRWDNRPENITVINEQFISDRPYLLIKK